MADLINGVDNGRLLDTNNGTKQSMNPNALGKDAFLQLLATQMRYQDPLNPNTDTQFVAQLATFSQLEQLQNLNKTNTNTQAFGLVGKTVIVKGTDSLGNTNYVSGKVNFTTMTNGEAQLSINGNLYPASNLDTVLDEDFIKSLGLPTVAKAELSIDKANLTEQIFQVNLGSGDNAAKKVSVKIGGKQVEDKYVQLSNGFLILQKDAFANLEVGVHEVEISFDDVSKTVIKNKVTLEVSDTTKQADTQVKDPTIA